MSRLDRVKSWWGLLLLGLLLLLWTVRPIGVMAPAHVESEFQAERAVARLAMILGDERPHPTDSDANDAVEARLLEQIRAQKGTTIPNSSVVSTMPICLLAVVPPTFCMTMP